MKRLDESFTKTLLHKLLHGNCGKVIDIDNLYIKENSIIVEREQHEK